MIKKKQGLWENIKAFTKTTKHSYVPLEAGKRKLGRTYEELKNNNKLANISEIQTVIESANIIEKLNINKEYFAEFLEHCHSILSVINLPCYISGGSIVRGLMGQDFSLENDIDFFMAERYNISVAHVELYNQDLLIKENEPPSYDYGPPAYNKKLTCKNGLKLNFISGQHFNINSFDFDPCKTIFAPHFRENLTGEENYLEMFGFGKKGVTNIDFKELVDVVIGKYLYLDGHEVLESLVTKRINFTEKVPSIKFPERYIKYSQIGFKFNKFADKLFEHIMKKTNNMENPEKFKFRPIAYLKVE